MPSSIPKPIFDQNANSKSSFWRTANRKNKTKSLAKLFVVIVIAFALMNFITKIPGWFQNINKPFEQIQTNIQPNGVVNGDIRTNILLISISDSNNLQDLALASFNSDKSSLIILNIPISSKTYLAASEQDLSLAATYFSKPYLDSEFDSLYIATQETLALPLDGYFAFFGDNFEFSEEQIEKTKNKLGFFNLLTNSLSYKSWLNSNLKTNYAVSSIFSLVLDFRRLNKEKISLVTLEEAVEKMNGNRNFVFSKVDNIIRDNLLDNAITKERVVVEVVGEGFYAHLIDRVVNNLGASTVNIGTDDQSSETRVIVNSDKEKLARRLADYLKVNLEKGEINSGSDVKVVVGSDFEAKFYLQ